jgi:hypothetical protein
MGMTQDQGAMLRIPLRLIVDMNVTGKGIRPSLINGFKSNTSSFRSEKTMKLHPVRKLTSWCLSNPPDELFSMGLYAPTLKFLFFNGTIKSAFFSVKFKMK